MAGIVRAPEIDRPDVQWFNVEGPLSLAALRGKLLILDFWTYCCVNCIHVLPTLRRVEDAFPEEVVVIGVHSPKFPAERDPEKVRSAIARYGIAHPVAHDPEFHLWRSYAVRAWPTLVFVSPDGRVVGQHAGEPAPEMLMSGVRDLLARFRQEGRIHPQPLRLAPEPVEHGRLLFPGKIKPFDGDASAPPWALADSGHHQIVLLDDDGRERRRIGSGQAGFADGALEQAAFNEPQGLVCRQGAIYVADTGNHAVRRIDLERGTVSTVAGTGRRGGILGSAPSPGRETALASPWDLELLDGRLLVANAGTHQLGEIDLAAGTVRRLVGNGTEGLFDGPADSVHMAQPSGLALGRRGRVLYVADSETSAIRAVDLSGPPYVTTLVGKGLFDFGHENGGFEDALLQHALGVAVSPDGKLLVADSYNDALRVIDPDERVVTDLDDGRLACTDPVCRPLAEPAGVAVAGPGRLLVSDTNNHRVLEYRLDEGTYRTWAN